MDLPSQLIPGSMVAPVKGYPDCSQVSSNKDHQRELDEWKRNWETSGDKVKAE
jgi:hypothetical protein